MSLTRDGESAGTVALQFIGMGALPPLRRGTRLSRKMIKYTIKGKIADRSLEAILARARELENY